MTPRQTAFIAGAAIALYVATGAAAFAQAPAPGAPPSRGDRVQVPPERAGAPQRNDRLERRTLVIRNGEREMRFERGEMRRRDPAEHLRAVLQLKPAQDAALTAYLAALRPPAPQVRAANTPAPKTTPERLALEEKRLTDRTAQVRARLDATRRFYDQLDAGQKRAFDELAPMMGDRGHGMGPAMPVMMRHMPMPPMAPMAPPPPRS
jgi:hypothetical protein